MTERTILLDGLSCSKCAARITGKVKSFEGVEDARLDLDDSRLVIEIDDGNDPDKVVRDAAKVAQRIEPSLRIERLDGSEIDTIGDIVEEEAEDDGEDEDSEEEEDAKAIVIRLCIGTALLIAGLAAPLPWIAKLVVFIAAYTVTGYTVVAEALKKVAHGYVFSEEFLMTVATVGAFCVGEYPEGVMVMLLYLLGELLEDKAVDRSRRSISELMDIRPDYANVVVGSQVERVLPSQVCIGEQIVVRPGEKIPLDGRVVSGSSFVDTVALTGESTPRMLHEGDEALSGCVNKSGLLTIEVEKEFGESTVSKVLDLVENASSKKAPAEKFITKFARYYTPCVCLGALLVATIPPLFVAGAQWADWIHRALVFLVASCPCALVISVPLGFLAGIGGASKRGILVKGGNYFEALSNVGTVVFDKTGTLTKGTFDVVRVDAAEGSSRDDVLELAAYAEHFSNHPIAASIERAYGREVDVDTIGDFEEVEGKGVGANVFGHSVSVGNDGLLEMLGMHCGCKVHEGTVVHVAEDGKLIGSIVIADEAKDDSKVAVASLKSIGVGRVCMLTGDSQTIAQRIEDELGLDEGYAELLPADKVDHIEELEAQAAGNGNVAFVGDGINDAPVLARADIGIAMGGLGSDAAVEAADVVIMDDKPSKVPLAMRIAKRTRQIVMTNIVFALTVKAVIIVLGVMGIATMWEAVFADMGVTLIAVLNSTRALSTSMFPDEEANAAKACSESAEAA